MKIILLCVGKTTSSKIDALIGEYEGRLRHYVNFEITFVEVGSKTKSKTAAQQKELEGELILANCKSSAPLILLDEKGKRMPSTEFAKFIQGEMNRGPKELVFCVGGAFGFSEQVYQKAVRKISLSDMTFTHQMVRLFFTEQLYRAFTILKGEKYHH